MAVIFIFSKVNLKYLKNLMNKVFYHEVSILFPSKTQCLKVLISSHPNDLVYPLFLHSYIFLLIIFLFVPILLLNLSILIDQMPMHQFMSLSLYIKNIHHFLLLKLAIRFPQFLLIFQDLPTKKSMQPKDFNQAKSFSCFNN